VNGATNLIEVIVYGVNHQNERATEYSLVDETCLKSDLKGKAREAASQENSETLQPST